MSGNRRSSRAISNAPVYSTNQAQARIQNMSPTNQRQYQNNQAAQQQPQPQQQPPLTQEQLQQQLLQQHQHLLQLQQQTQAQLQQNEAQQPPLSSIPVPDKLQKEEVSATGKALALMEVDEDGKKKWKKGPKLPLAIRRKRMNNRLSKILTPKSALILLHEFKPGCTYKVQEQPGTIPPVFVAHVEHNNAVLAAGQGMSKSQAKNAAAENAIKSFVSQAMTKRVEEAGNVEEQFSEDMNLGDGDDSKDPAQNLPWAGLASFAIYKMFTEWQNQGADVPMTRAAPSKPKKKNQEKAPAIKKELPANAAELHPSVLLNTMRPGIVATEINRTPGPNGSVTMGYNIDGTLFTGLGTSKKDARREAAKAVITALYGLNYST